MSLTMIQPTLHDDVACPHCRHKTCYVISTEPLKVWKCPKCKRVSCPITYHSVLEHGRGFVLR